MGTRTPRQRFPEFDIYAYDTVSHRLYQITKTPYDEILPAVSFDPATDNVHVAWTALQADENVYAATFKLEQPDVTNDESSPDPSKFGEPVTLTATVTPGTVFSPNLNATPPTGTIRFSLGYIYEPGTTIGTATLVPSGLTGSSTATLQTSSLPVGNDNIVATYGGDPIYEASATEGTHQIVQRAQTKTTLASSANPAQAGKSVTFTATVTPGTPGGATPTGSVSFTDNGSPIQSCSPAPLSGGAASCTVTYPGTGGHNIVASYGGDGNYLASTSATLTQLATLWLCPTLAGCNLHGLNLTGANFAGEDLSGANLQSTNLTHANLAGANLSSANLNLANLTGADLAGANLSGANLNGAIWSNTTCPDGTNSNADGGTCTGHL